MKVAYVTPFYTAACDGRFGRFHDCIHALRDASNPPFEFEVHAFMVGEPDETLASQSPGVLGSGDELWGTKRSNAELLLNSARIYRSLSQSDADIVHLIDTAPLLLPPVLASLEQSKLIVGPNIGGWYPIRNDDIWFSSTSDVLKAKSKYYLRMALFQLLPYDHTVAFSDHHGRMFDYLGVPEDSILSLGPGVDGRFKPGPAEKSDVPEILYVGDFSRAKGYFLFLEAVSQLDQPIDVRLIGAGDPNRERITELGLEECTTIEGFVDRGELPEYYRRADLHVVAAIDETGWTNTQMEALACGTPVVVTDAPPINEIDCPEAIVRFWPRTTDAIREAIERALDELSDLSDGANAHASEFHIWANVEQLDELYQSVV